MTGNLPESVALPTQFEAGARLMGEISFLIRTSIEGSALSTSTGCGGVPGLPGAYGTEGCAGSHVWPGAYHPKGGQSAIAEIGEELTRNLTSYTLRFRLGSYCPVGHMLSGLAVLSSQLQAMARFSEPKPGLALA